MTQYILLRAAHSNKGLVAMSIHDTPQEANDARNTAMIAYATQLNAERDAAYQAGEASEARVTKDILLNLFLVLTVTP